jgi:hypothetical protein
LSYKNSNKKLHQGGVFNRREWATSNNSGNRRKLPKNSNSNNNNNNSTE